MTADEILARGLAELDDSIATVHDLHGWDVEWTNDEVLTMLRELRASFSIPPATARKSPRCPGSNDSVAYAKMGHIVDCPKCARPMRAMRAGYSISYARIPSHGTVETVATRAADERARFLRDRGMDR